MRAQIDAAQGELSANLAELRNAADGDAGLIARGEAQLGALAALQGQLDSASPTALAMLRAAVAASVAASANLAQQARTAASSATPSVGGPSLASATADARSTVTAFERDMYERKIFDPYLHFASKAEEDAYRQREAQRLAETKRAEAEHTPQGELRALKLSMDQLNDAGAHGADRSPQFHTMHDGIAADTARLEAAMKREATPAADPLDAVAPSALVDPALIAALRQTGARLSTEGEQRAVPNVRPMTAGQSLSQ